MGSGGAGWPEIQRAQFSVVKCRYKLHSRFAGSRLLSRIS